MTAYMPEDRRRTLAEKLHDLAKRDPQAARDFETYLDYQIDVAKRKGKALQKKPDKS